MQTDILLIQDMHNEDCADKVNEVLEAVDGVRAVTVSLAKQAATVVYDEARAGLPQFESALAQAGCGLETLPRKSSCCGGCCN